MQYMYLLSIDIHTLATFPDISKAFDKINHNILIDKLNLYDFIGIAFDIILITESSMDNDTKSTTTSMMCVEFHRDKFLDLYFHYTCTPMTCQTIKQTCKAILFSSNIYKNQLNRPAWFSNNWTIGSESTSHLLTSTKHIMCCLITN